MNNMTDLLPLVGFLLPPFIDLINKNVSKASLRFVFSLLICIGVGILISVPKLRFESPKEVLESIALVMTASQITYQMLYKDSVMQYKVRGAIGETPNIAEDVAFKE